MKRLTIQLINLFFVVMLFPGCDQDRESTDQKVAVTIEAGIKSRASNAEWAKGDKIGVTMYRYNEKDFMQECFNIPFTNQDNAYLFTPISPEAALYYPEDGSRVSFKSYYPYKEDLTEDHNYPVGLADQSNLPAIDLMTAEHLNISSLETPTVKMQFYHRLSKVIFILSFAEGTTGNYKDFDLTVRGMKINGNYNIANDLLTIYDSNYSDLFIPLRKEHVESEEEYKRVGIVFPRPEGPGVTVHLTHSNGNYYSGAMDPELELEEGYKYLIKIVISGPGTPGGDGEPLQLEVIEIEPWADGGDYILEAN